MTTHRLIPAVAFLVLGHASVATADPADGVCRLIAASAQSRDLPVAFLTRLVWRESSFRRDAVSPVGAEGIAQFMPGTARERGLADPFDPVAAIPQAAALLSELRDRFGNLGLAAAAYNAGSARVAAWLAGRNALPAETQTYVRDVTGRPAADWADGNPDLPDRDIPCPDALAAIARSRPEAVARSVLLAPWGVQLAGAVSRGAALAAFHRQQALYLAVLGDLQPMVVGGRKPGRGYRAFFQVRAPAPTRTVAERLCAALLRAGGACSVLRS